jgi:hypothetical protein
MNAMGWGMGSARGVAVNVGVPRGDVKGGVAVDVRGCPFLRQCGRVRGAARCRPGQQQGQASQRRQR